MKRLRPNFQRPSRIIPFALLTATAGIFLSSPAPIVHAGQLQTPPQWIRVEMQAINLYEAGINQENSDPQAAVKTLRQARLDSTAAIANGGGCNAAVIHNDSLIGRALLIAETDAAKSPENTQAAQNQSTGGKNLVAAGPLGNRIGARPAGRHAQIAAKFH